MKHTGSCLCGEIVFEIEGDFENFYLCHCGLCRKDTGSAHAANLFSSTAKLKWLSGKNKVKTYQFKSTRHIKSFCPDCGSALPNIQMDGTLLVVPAGCLDTEVPIRPQGHIYMASKANWDNDLDKVPRFDQVPK
ncbi:GFA family protein [Vallitalea maricola]|uniref:GFA family protein n=1 Tax=Vallitalea maricola TaxID=3074433 RepID=A0ACB5UGQ4_9FIRM|nr:GFA family protein [Vallitalea sp. AN17-2]